VYIEKLTKLGAAGIYVAAVELPGPDGASDHWWVSLAFPYDVANIPHASLQLQRYRSRLGPAHLRDATKLLRHALAPAPQHSVWRSLQLDVSPQGIAAYWEGKPVGTVTADQIEESLKQWAVAFANSPAPARPAAEVLLRGGLGLYNENAETLFRRVVVEPLP
jgi:hypothetical protein